MSILNIQIENLHFEWPFMAALLILPLLVRFLTPAIKRKVNLPILHFPHLEILRTTFGGATPAQKQSNKIFTILLSLFWLCLTLTLMRPQIVDQMTEVENQGYDIMLAVDLSGSMRALDFSTEKQMINRLDVAKVVVGDFVKERKNDRAGLILFGDYAYQYAPLTFDTASVSKMLNDTVISMAGDGTAIGDAIGLAVKSLRDRPEKSRIVILLTDGEDTASSIPPAQAAKLAKEYGIKIYTIGIGSTSRVPYPDQYGGIVMANMRLDEVLLKNIAQTTGGSYFKATDPQALKKTYEKINALEKSKAETRQYLIRTPLYRYPLGAGILCLITMALLPLLRRREVRHAT